MTVEQWTTQEFTFHDEAACHSVVCGISAEFTGPHGQIIRREAFWDGGDTFKIRFAPTELGEWKYQIAGLASGTENGTIDCIPYSGPYAIYQHGFLRVADHKQHLCYADGTPFFWLGDTHWQFATEERWDESNNPRYESQFRGVVDKRLSQGFSVYQCNLYFIRDGGPFEHAEVPFLEKDGSFEANLHLFRDNLDLKIGYLADQGMVTAAGLTWHDQILKPGGIEYYRMAARYVYARYGSYPWVWTLAGEVGGYYGMDTRKILVDAWNVVAHDIVNMDDYHHLRTVHYTNERPFADYYQDEDWLDFTLNQSGHGDYPIDYRAITAYRKKYPNRPFVEGESMYENILTLEPNGRRRATAEMVRRVAYITLQSGGCGYTYGAQGLWFMQWDEQKELPKGGLHFGSYDPWYVGLDYPSADDMGRMRRFYEEIGWAQLRPLPEEEFGVSGSGSLVVSLRSEDMKLLYTPFVTADQERNTVVSYFAATNVYPLVIQLPEGKNYRVRWFHPENGTWTDVGNVRVQGKWWKSPAKTDDRDMLLVLNTL